MSMMHRVREFTSGRSFTEWAALVACLVFCVADLLAPTTPLAPVGFILVAALVAAHQQRQGGLAAPATPGTAVPAFDLPHMFAQLDYMLQKLTQSIEAIDDVTSQQTIGASEQADLIARTNSLLTDFIELSQRVQGQARSLAEMARQTAESSQSGQAAIQQALQGMDQARDQVSAIANTILSLAQLTQRIDDIITSVSEIAIQSNLLALNASIEAARAGVHGRGFAVVADEVRSLSQQSTQAAQQVRVILGEIQAAMKETVRATEEGLKGVDAGVAMTQQADSVIIQLAENVAASQQALNHVYDVIRQQINGLEEMSITMERIDRITQRSLASAHTVDQVSLELAQLTSELQLTVGIYSPGVKKNAHYHAEENTG